MEDFTKANGDQSGFRTRTYAAQATDVLLDRDRRRPRATRGQVAQHLFNQDVKDGILGNFKIDENGDTTLGTVSVWQVKGQKGVFLKD